MNSLTESLVLELPQDLAQVAAAAARVLAWCRLHGVVQETLTRIELPFVEAANNAVRHGCAGHPGAVVEVRVRVLVGRVIVTVTDPGHFEPGADWADLPLDPLSENGRGGFLIQNGTESFRHLNGAFGHTLELEWITPMQPGFNLLSAAAGEEIAAKLTEELANSFETLLGITHFTGLLATTSDFPELLTKVRERLASMLPLDSLVARFIEDGALRLHCIGECPTLPYELPLDGAFSEAACARTGRAQVGTRSDLAKDDPLARFAEHICLLPVQFGGRRLGTIATLRSRGGQPFRAAEVEILQAVADFVGVAKQTATLWRERNEQLRLEQEIRVAATIQSSLLPSQFPTSGSWRVHGECVPAREVGGDYFDVIPRNDGSVVLLIADVMGKGLPASLVAAMLRSSIRSLVPTHNEPGPILSALNQLLFEDLERLGMFITAVLVILPADASRMAAYANAGHCPPVVLGATSLELDDRNGGVPIGVIPHAHYESYPLRINRGQNLMLYTDGCYEVPDPNGRERVGRDVFISTASALMPADPMQMTSRLLDPEQLQLEQDWIGDDRTLLLATPRT